MDYKELCEELFGTTDKDELAEIARVYHAGNPRNAGRKPKLKTHEIEEARTLHEKGETVSALAARYGVSRQLMHQLLHQKITKGCSTRLTLMDGPKPCTDIDVDFAEEKIYIRNFTEDMLHRAFGVLEQPTWEDFQWFLQDRCFSENRADKKEILSKLNLQSYDPLQIIEKTKGKISDDALWIKVQYKGDNGERN